MSEYCKNCYKLTEENEKIKKDVERWKSNFNGKVTAIAELLEQLDQLKAEVKSKTEYIQEQREIIDQYSKEIEMYKKCQGKRASKREEELKAENENLKQYKASKQASYESMQREWNRAVNANRELKADNKHLNDLLNQALKELEQSREAIEKVREILIKTPTDSREHFLNAKSVILQICDEVK